MDDAMLEVTLMAPAAGIMEVLILAVSRVVLRTCPTWMDLVSIIACRFTAIAVPGLIRESLTTILILSGSPRKTGIPDGLTRRIRASGSFRITACRCTLLKSCTNRDRQRQHCCQAAVSDFLSLYKPC